MDHRQKLLKNKAADLLDVLREKRTFDGQDEGALGNTVVFNTKMTNRERTLIRIARLSALLEREGILVPDVNRQGVFVGWHINTNL